MFMVFILLTPIIGLFIVWAWRRALDLKKKYKDLNGIAVEIFYIPLYNLHPLMFNNTLTEVYFLQ